MSHHAQAPDNHGFQRYLAVRKVGEGGLVHDIEANETERSRLAAFLGVLSLESLGVQFRVQRWRARGLKLEGVLRARVVQSCVVTLEPVESIIETRFERRFLPAEMIDPEGDGGDDIFVDPEGEDPPEPMTHEIDLGAIAVEELALGIDPYPRKPGSSFAADEAAGDASSASPFAALAKLKGRLGPKP
jgi:hypothetical protein